MKNIVFLFIAVFVIYSCGSKNNTSLDKTGEVKSNEIVVTDISIDSLIANPSAFANKTVQFTAMVDHVCKHGGQKLTVVGTLPDKTIKVMATDFVPQFDTSLNGMKVEIVGVVKGVAEEQTESCGETAKESSQPKNVTYVVECQSVKSL